MEGGTIQRGCSCSRPQYTSTWTHASTHPTTPPPVPCKTLGCSRIGHTRVQNARYFPFFGVTQHHAASQCPKYLEFVFPGVGTSTTPIRFRHIRPLSEEDRTGTLCLIGIVAVVIVACCACCRETPKRKTKTRARQHIATTATSRIRQKSLHCVHIGDQH